MTIMRKTSDYFQSSPAAQNAWFAYKQACETEIRKPISVVDFVAGFNAGMKFIKDKLDGIDD